ncbi:MAG: hypothetical protein JW958_08340 [Candidatus Eisenbacteria bacterium]|nr:hypothetical protein [Candidatus Eisenbacteria bacterium]
MVADSAAPIDTADSALFPAVEEEPGPPEAAPPGDSSFAGGPGSPDAIVGGEERGGGEEEGARALPQPVSIPLVRVATPPDPAGTWRRTAVETRAYAPRTWADVAAALPLTVADRFGPPGYFETIRLGGSGSPLVLIDGIPWPREAGGLVNGNALPRAGVASLSVVTPRLLPEAAAVAPDGAILLETEPWRGGDPVSYVDAEQGSGGYRDYRFGISRDVTARLSVQLNGSFRKADQYVIDSYRSSSSDIRVGFPLREDILLRAGLRTYKDEQILINPTLQEAIFSHDGRDERRLLFLEASFRGMVGQAYRSKIHSVLEPRSAAFDRVRVVEERDGLLLSHRRFVSGTDLSFGLRVERKKAETEDLSREEWGAVAAAGAEAPLSGGFRLRIAAAEEFADGASYTDAEGAILREGRVPILLRLARLWERPTARDWVPAVKERDVLRSGEIGCSFPFLPARPGIRFFRREGDAVRRLLSVDAFRQEGERIDERTLGWEIHSTIERGRLSVEAAYARFRAREDGSDERPAYHGDHLVRGRVSFTHPIPWFEWEPRWDVLGEWRSDRNAPDRETPMSGYAYLRGRVTISPRGGVLLFGQMEQATGHALEYFDGAGGEDGVLSGTQQIVLGVIWPFRD